MAQADSKPIKKVFLQFPENWDSLTQEQKRAVAAGMATEVQKKLRKG